jgi:hypothetical protein
VRMIIKRGVVMFVSLPLNGLTGATLPAL